MPGDHRTGRRESALPLAPVAGPVRLGIADGDAAFARVLVRRVEAAGWRVHRLPDLADADQLTACKLHALVVDPVLLGESAGEWIERVCSGLPALAVVACSERSTVAERVKGLRLGLDDWIDKPCHPEELMARVEAAVRRRRFRPAAAAVPVVAGEVVIKPDLFQAFVGSQSLELTRREFELLSLLAESDGRVLERERIYESVWGYSMARGDRSVDVFVRKLRRKLDAGSPGWAYIHTHVGVGYRFDPEPRGRGE